ncbi:MAG: hypothetical protein U0Y10_05775 [Spirosomataceae bacterium]
MKNILALSFGLLLSLPLVAQNTKIQLTKVKLAAKQEPFDIYQVQFKVLSGTAKNQTEVAIVQNGELKGYAQLAVIEPISAGQSTKFDEALYVLNGTVSVGQTLASYDIANFNVPTKRAFSFKTATAFLGDKPNEFSTSISDLKGMIKIGDEFEYQNFKGQRAKGKITSIDLAQTLHPPVLIEGLPSSALMGVVITSDNGADFTKASVSSIGGLGAAPSVSQANPSRKVTGKTQTIPVNVVLQNDEVKITVHNLIKFNPDPTQSQYDLFKVDYSLDYYIVDATVENISSHEVDSGEYLVRFNFFSPDGKSADEFLRMFKKQNNNNDTQNQADVIDKMALGGTSKIKTAGVMVKYQEMIPDYEQNHKPIVDALYKKLAPGQKLHSIMATLMAVPPSYKIEGLGTWKGTFFDKKNLLFVPVRR